jgi:hypothetical protein
MKMLRDELAPPVLVREQVAPTPPAPKPAPKPRVDMRDDLKELLTLLQLLGNWKRFKKGFRPANQMLWDVIEKIKKVI